MRWETALMKRLIFWKWSDRGFPQIFQRNFAVEQVTGHPWLKLWSDNTQVTGNLLSVSSVFPQRATWLHYSKVRRGSWELCIPFIFIFLSSFLILFQTKRLLLLDTHSPSTQSLSFLTVESKELEEPQKGCQAPSVYRPSLESSSKLRHSWHPVQEGLALSNYLASLVQYDDLGMLPLAILPLWRWPGCAYSLHSYAPSSFIV